MRDIFLAVHNVYAAVTDVVAEHANWSTVPCMTFSVCVELVYSSLFRFLSLSTFDIYLYLEIKESSRKINIANRNSSRLFGQLHTVYTEHVQVELRGLGGWWYNYFRSYFRCKR